MSNDNKKPELKLCKCRDFTQEGAMTVKRINDDFYQCPRCGGLIPRTFKPKEICHICKEPILSKGSDICSGVHYVPVHTLVEPKVDVMELKGIMRVKQEWLDKYEEGKCSRGRLLQELAQAIADHLKKDEDERT